MWELCVHFLECAHGDRLKAAYRSNTSNLHNIPALLNLSSDIKAFIDNIEWLYAEDEKQKVVAPEVSPAVVAEATQAQQASDVVGGEEVAGGEVLPSDQSLLTSEVVVEVGKSFHMLPLATVKDAVELATHIKAHPSHNAGVVAKVTSCGCWLLDPSQYLENTQRPWHSYRRWRRHDTILLKAMHQSARPQDYIIVFDGHETVNRQLIRTDSVSIFLVIAGSQMRWRRCLFVLMIQLNISLLFTFDLIQVTLVFTPHCVRRGRKRGCLLANNVERACIMLPQVAPSMNMITQVVYGKNRPKDAVSCVLTVQPIPYPRQLLQVTPAGKKQWMSHGFTGQPVNCATVEGGQERYVGRDTSSAAASSGVAIMQLTSMNKALQDSYKWVGLGHCRTHCAFLQSQLVDKMKASMSSPSSSFYRDDVNTDDIKSWFQPGSPRSP